MVGCFPCNIFQLREQNDGETSLEKFLESPMPFDWLSIQQVAMSLKYFWRT
jgi:hypothetical protein